MHSVPVSPRVVVASRLFAPEVTAASFRVTALASVLADRGAIVVALTTKPPVEVSHDADPVGVRVSRWPVLRDRSGAIRGYLQYASFDIPLFFRLLARPADVIVAEAPPTTGLVALWAAWLRRAPLVYYPGDVWTDGVKAMGASRVVVGVMEWIETQVLRGAARSLAISPEVGERLEAMGADSGRVIEVGNGIDTAVFRPDVVPALSERPYFVYTGTMSEWQQPDIFIRALAMIDDVELRFFGQGSAEPGLRELAARIAPGRVHFGGLVSPAESAAWIRGAVAALVSIAPGIGYDFARPTKTYAAAACGTPVLFTGATTGGTLVTEAGLGRAVAFTPDAVAAAMSDALADVESGARERHRASRAAWAQHTVSLGAVGARAAQVVWDAAVSRSRS